MRVLQVFNSDVARGGGAIAMHRLQAGLRRAGVDSRILCRSNTGTCPDAVEIPRFPRLERQLWRVTDRLGLNDVHCVSSFKIKGMPAYKEADILNLHCIHGGFFSYLALPWLTADKPAVFTLHDMWPFTGHCAQSYDCERWKTGCGQCPYPDTYPPIWRDGTRLEWKLKDWVYRRSRLGIVAPSEWIAGRAKQSMLSCFPIVQIPHGIDPDVYRPLDREHCRSVLRIPRGKNVLMCAALRLFHRGKGMGKAVDLLLGALRSLPASLKSETMLLLVGDGGDALAEATGLPTLNLGYVSSDHLKAIAYSAADVFVHPTRAESFGLVLLESMACGTPMVSFRVGDVPELVRPGITGYLAEPENAEELSHGIVRLLADEPQRSRMRERCRDIAVKEYPLSLHVERYMDLYGQMIARNGH